MIHYLVVMVMTPLLEMPVTIFSQEEVLVIHYMVVMVMILYSEKMVMTSYMVILMMTS